MADTFDVLPPPTPDDFQLALDELVAALDLDGDGVVSPQEAAVAAPPGVADAATRPTPKWGIGNPRHPAYQAPDLPVNGSTDPETGALNVVIERPQLDRARVRPGELPYMPPLPPRQPAELRRTLSPEVDTFMGVTGLAGDDPTISHYLSQRTGGLVSGAGSLLDDIYRLGSAGPRQVQKAESAIGTAIDDPSLGNIANAGTQTGMAALRPAIALPSLAVQYGDAIVKDLGLLDSNAVQAQAPLLRRQQRDMEMERQRREGQADIERRAAETEARLGRETAEAALARELEAERVRRERAAIEEARERAKDALAVELARTRRFQDTATGKVWDDTGGLAPAILGGAAGLYRRAGNPGVTHGQLLKSGAIAGAAAVNTPLVYESYFTPVENPEKRGYEAYWRTLDPKDPRRDEWQAYADPLPTLNPVRGSAQAELYSPWKAPGRLAFGALEGALGAEFGAGTWGIPARGLNALGRGAAATTSRLLPQGPPPAPRGGGPSGIPSARSASEAPTAVPAAAGPTPLGPSGGQPQLPLADRVRAADQRLQREALPSPDASQPLLPKWAEREGHKVGVNPNNPNQTQRPDGKWGPNVDGLRRQSKTPSDTPQSKPATKAGKPEQSMNPEGPIIKEPGPPMSDLAPYGRPERGGGRSSSYRDRSNGLLSLMG